jgi:hypothetical protein
VVQLTAPECSHSLFWGSAEFRAKRSDSHTETDTTPFRGQWRAPILRGLFRDAAGASTASFGCRVADELDALAQSTHSPQICLQELRESTSSLSQYRRAASLSRFKVTASRIRAHNVTAAPTRLLMLLVLLLLSLVLLSLLLLILLLCESYPRNRPWSPIGLWDVKDPTLSRQSAQS